MKRKRPKKPPEYVGSVMEMRAGPAPTVTEAGGRVWRLGWNTQDAKAELESIILSHAIRETVKEVKAVGGTEGEEHYTRFQNRKEAGYYHTFGEGWKYTMASPDGSWMFLLSLLMHAHPHAAPADAQRLIETEPEQVALAVGTIAPDFFAAVLAQKKMTAGTAPEKVRAVVAQLAAVVLTQFPTPHATRAPATG